MVTLRWWMSPDELSVLVRKQATVLEINLVSLVDSITFELMNNLRDPTEAWIQCHEDEEGHTVPVLDNLDGSLSMPVTPSTNCKILVELY